MSPRPPGALLAVVVVLVASAGTVAAGAGATGPPAVAGEGAQSAAGTADAVRDEAATGALGVDAAPTGAVAADGPSGDAVTTHTPNRTREPGTVTMRVRLQPDGDARWEVSLTVGVRDDTDEAAFEELAADFENGEVSLGLDAFRRAAGNASAATGREMTLRNVERTTSRTETEGTLTLAFTWSNFARTDGPRLSVGDAFNTTDGTWLPRLTARETLVVVPPPEYGVVSAPEVGIADGAARWEGPYDFDGREPWVVYSGDTPTSTTAPTTTAPVTTTLPPTTSEPGPADGGLPSALTVAALVVVAAASAALLAVYVRREGGPGSGPDSGTGADPVDGSGPGPDDGGTAAEPASGAGDAPADRDGTAQPESAGGSAPDGAATPEAGATDPEAAAAGESEPADGAASAGAAAAGSGGADAGTDADDGGGSDEVDEALLSDEERVERLLERNGGRMKQADIVKATGWSNAKVSQLLSAMAEDDRVDKLRIGRENLISFPDEDVADIGSDEE